MEPTARVILPIGLLLVIWLWWVTIPKYETVNNNAAEAEET